MEARGIEPRSCLVSILVSTLLVYCYRTTNKTIRLSESGYYNHKEAFNSSVPSLSELSESTQLGKKVCVTPAA